MSLFVVLPLATVFAQAFAKGWTTYWAAVREPDAQAAIRRADSGEVLRLGRYHVQRKENLDGVKFFLDAPTNGNGAEAWVLLRASGTEPLLRIMLEGQEPDAINRWAEEIATAVKSRLGS